MGDSMVHLEDGLPGLLSPWKINGWNPPTNHPFRKENDLNQTSMLMFHVNLQGCRDQGIRSPKWPKHSG